MKFVFASLVFAFAVLFNSIELNSARVPQPRVERTQAANEHLATLQETQNNAHVQDIFTQNRNQNGFPQHRLHRARPMTEQFRTAVQDIRLNGYGQNAYGQNSHGQNGFPQNRNQNGH